ncbi:uncharacterized protein LOC141602438 [Silene latifolia]|uniref:uncharacterized protein LOC141602438 n=1 Tax=Silene latifolia TaxID=37657 RepID=UPI003D773571
MCRISEYNHDYPCKNTNSNLNRRLTLTTFTLNLSLSSTSSSSNLPETLTLVFLPRVNGARIQVNGVKIRPVSPAFVTLYRTRAAAYSAVGEIKVCDGAAFEVHAAEIRVLKGVFREINGEELGKSWRVECKYMGDERRIDVMGVKVTEMEVVVVAEECSGVLLKAKAKAEGKMKGFRRVLLAEIPEVMEDDVEEGQGDGEEEEEGKKWDEAAEMVEAEMDGVKWVVEVGFWVGCLGVGLLVSRVSSRSLWRRKLLV